MMHHAVLASVEELGPVSQATLSRTLGVDPKEMVAVVQDLDRDGLVERRPDPADRRKHAVEISARGRELLARTERLGAPADHAPPPGPARRGRGAPGGPPAPPGRAARAPP